MANRKVHRKMDQALDADDSHFEWHRRQYPRRWRLTDEQVAELRARIAHGDVARTELNEDLVDKKAYEASHHAWQAGYDAGRRREREDLAEQLQLLETARQQAEMRCRSIERAWEGEMQARRAAQTGALKWESSKMPRSGELVLIECRQQYNRVSPPYPPPWIICCGYYDADTGKWRSGSHYTLAIQVRRWAKLPTPPEICRKEPAAYTGNPGPAITTTDGR